MKITIALSLVFLSLLSMLLLGCTQVSERSQPASQQTNNLEKENTGSASSDKTAGETLQQQNSEPQAPETHIVRMEDGGYTPSTLTIKKGDTVIFINYGTRPNWPASANHPTHEVYPEGGGCISSAFDACRGLLPGENFTFVFNKIGEWGYHNHLQPTSRGKIIVQQ
ncbi:MAG: cupredoxin domain-containing protein [Candidatus Anstonellales archaeon]